MNTISFNDLSSELAKKIIAIAYEMDRTSTYRGDYEINGSIIHAKAIAGEKRFFSEQGKYATSYKVVLTCSQRDWDLRESYSDFLSYESTERINEDF